MLVTPESVVRGREAFGRCRWDEAYALLSLAHDRLEPPDLERLATAAYLIGRDDESTELLTRAHQAFLSAGDIAHAARSAFWLASWASAKGDFARGGGWVARAQRLLDDGGSDCVERGYLLVAEGRHRVMEGDFERAGDAFAQAARTGDRFKDRDLIALAGMGCGRVLIRRGDASAGAALLDEAMVAVTAGELSPIVSGIIYCSVISACFEMSDMRRATEWTGALSRWCAEQPDLVAYRGHCLVQRAEVLAWRGSWADAIDEARRACAHVLRVAGQPETGAAFYQLAELHRLQGRFAEAEEAYVRAREAGRSPQPGLALLRLAQGRPDAAAASLIGALAEARDTRLRTMLLSAHVETLLASKDLAAARQAADELSAIASDARSPFAQAASASAQGAVALAAGDAKRALAALGEARGLWRDLDAPYQAARVSVMIGLACRALGDVDGSRIELDAAARVFKDLGAGPDLTRMEELSSVPAAAPPSNDDPLTDREVQVLKLVASGKSNRAIADALEISEKTVARHISNIFTKLDLSSRAAATAYAYQHGIV